MIKLIATDMDGTLLNEHGNLPDGFFEMLDKLNEKDIKFVAASGRPYFTLYENFKPASDKIDYLADNGAFVVENGNVTSIEIIDKRYVNAIIKLCKSISNITIILCGTKGAYHEPCDKEYLTEIDKYYYKKNIVDDLTKVDDDIFKITICDLSDASKNAYPILSPIYGDDLMVVVSGLVWIDIMNKGINKGNGLEKIQESLGITPEETMVFGDYYNDVEMLKKAKYSFVMANALDDMKQYGNYIAKSNTENGVIKAIYEYVLA